MKQRSSAAYHRAAAARARGLLVEATTPWFKEQLAAAIANTGNFIESGPRSHPLAGKNSTYISQLAREATNPIERTKPPQNIGRITVCYERIPGALEQGNFGSHQGIELGNQVLSGKELFLALFGICAKRK